MPRIYKITFFLALGLSLLTAFFSRTALAESEKKAIAKLEPIYGEGLYNVPVVMREAFLDRTGKLWHQVTDHDRYWFIKNWKNQETAAIESRKTIAKKKKLRDKELQGKEREHNLELLQEKRKEMERERKKISEKNAQKKELAKKIAEREKILRKLRQLQNQKRD
ncbi:MAG: hypothetical protein HQL16_01305 [Candidatus Omnitrophica bacterium]|nr:hypothetical protein [Candidatus Omnitrophota bacterium]